MISLDLYAIFVKVAETQSFSQAAQDLGVAKATVSKRVAELEQVLGVALIARTTRKLALTEAGTRVLPRAQRLVEEGEAIEAEANETRAFPRGRLRVAAPLSFTLRHLAPILPDFCKAYPEIQLELDLDDRTIDLIGDGFDVALRIGPMPDSSMTARRIAPVALAVVAAPAYWAARGRPERPEDLAGHACFRYANQAGGVAWRFTHLDGREARVHVDGPICVNNGDAMLPAICAGLGVALLPDFIVHEERAAKRLEQVLTDWRANELWLHLLTPPGRGLTRRVRAFSDFVNARFGAGKAAWVRPAA
jgi:DNA-binding transcriptional LysR family regulator